MQLFFCCVCLWASSHLASALRQRQLSVQEGVSNATAREDKAATSYGNSNSPAKVFYLMLVEDNFEQENIWADFFQGQPRSEFEVLVHCADSPCLKNPSSDLFKVIPHVPSSYCSNLVNPMLALLQSAKTSALELPDPKDPRHKYVFVSHNSVPLKPFAEVQRTLLEGKEGTANFDEWGYHCGGLKSAMWFVLSFSHLERILRDSGGPQSHLNNGFSKKWTFFPNGCSGCSDEQYFIVTLFGDSTNKPDFRGARYWFIDWDRMGQRILLGNGTGPAGPATVTGFTLKGLCELRRGKEIFLRKVAPNANFVPDAKEGSQGLKAAFHNYIFKADSACLDSRWDYRE